MLNRSQIEWNKRNPNYYIEYYNKNKDIIKDYKKDHYIKNRDIELAEYRERWRNDPEYRNKKLEYNKEYRQINLDKIKKQQAEYNNRTEIRERRSELGKIWRKDNAERIREYKHIILQKYKTKAIEILGGKCKHCGVTDSRFLCIDHVNNNGNEHRGVYKGYMFKWVVDNHKDFGIFPVQLLCFNCNLEKRRSRN